LKAGSARTVRNILFTSTKRTLRAERPTASRSASSKRQPRRARHQLPPRNLPANTRMSPSSRPAEAGGGVR
jgi:hypothetical protein